RPHRGHQVGSPHRCRAAGIGDHAPRGDRSRGHRRDQSPSRRRWDIRLPAPADPSISGIVVLAGHEPTGGRGMTTVSDLGAPPPTPAAAPATVGAARDHRGSWIPTGGMIATRFMDSRKRRGLMVALILVTIVIPTIFLLIRLLLPAFAPHSYGP